MPVSEWVIWEEVIGYCRFSTSRFGSRSIAAYPLCNDSVRKSPRVRVIGGVEIGPTLGLGGSD